MWVVALMAALMFGTIMSMDSGPDEPEVDDTAEDDGMTRDPVTPIDPSESETDTDTDTAAGDSDPAGTPAPDVTPDPEGTPDPEVTPDPEGTPEETPGIAVVNTGGATVLGSEGDDTLSPESFGSITVTTSATRIDLLGGDDVAELRFGSLYTTNVDGGAGDDTLVGETRSPLGLSGGTGDDVLSSISEGFINGEEGNDSISADLSGIFDENLRISGGDGDDLIQVATTIGEDNSFVGRADVRGDAGADIFELDFELADELTGDGVPASFVSDTGVEILDFNPAEDRLRIEITRPDGATERVLSDTTLTRNEAGVNGDGAAPYTDVEMTFIGSETVSDVTTTFRVFSAAPFSADDIEIVIVPPTPVAA